MIVYFADRYMNILGQGSTNLPDGIIIYDDKKIEEIDSGVATFEFSIPFSKDRLTTEKWTSAGNYILRKNDNETEFYTIIDTELDTNKEEISVYAEDAGLDLLNEVVGKYEAGAAMPIADYINMFAYDSGFEIGLNEISNLSRKLKWEGETTATERILSVATQFDNAEISFNFEIKNLSITKKLINIHKKRGVDLGVELRLNREVDRIVTKKTVANLATALIATGGKPENEENPITLNGYYYDDGDIHVEGGMVKSRSALKKWTRYLFEKGIDVGHIVQRYSYDTTSQSELCNRCVSELKKRYDTEINFEVTISILPKNVRIGDRVNIVDDAGELYLSSRILKLETSISNRDIKATLGEHLIKTSGISSKISELADQFSILAKNRTIYTWIAYADDNLGNGISLDPNGKSYLGLATGKTVSEVDISDPSIFTWAKIKGDDAKTNINIILDNEIQKISCTENGFVAADTVIQIAFNAFIFTNKVNCDVEMIGLPEDVDVISINSATDSMKGVIDLFIPEGASLGEAEAGRGTVILKFKSQGQEITKLWGWYKEYGNLSIASRTRFFLVMPLSEGVTINHDGWDTAMIPTTEVNKYLWCYEKTLFSNKSEKTTTPYILSIYNNEQLVTVWDTIVTYHVNDNGSIVPNGSWSTNILSASNEYLWTKTEIIYTNNTTSTTYSVQWVGEIKDGKDGTSLKNITEEYYLSTSNNELVGSEWVEIQPDFTLGFYMWTRLKVEYINPASVSYTDPVVNTTWEIVERLTERVQKTEGDITNIVQQTIDANTGWKISMAKIGAYTGTDISPVETSLTLNENGVYVSSLSKKGKRTEITADSFKGLYNDGLEDSEDQVIFSVDEQEVYSYSLLVDKGIDMRVMKQVTINYEGRNGIAFVKSGGGIDG